MQTQLRRNTRSWTLKEADDLRAQIDQTWKDMYKPVPKTRKSGTKRKAPEPEPIQQSEPVKKPHVEQSEPIKPTFNSINQWFENSPSDFVFEGRKLTIAEMPRCMVRFGKCYICHKEYKCDIGDTEYREQLACLLSPTAPHPAPILFYCKNNPYCTESARASLHADMATADWLPLPEEHKLAPSLKEGVKEKLWTVQRTSGVLEDNWFVMAARGIEIQAQLSNNLTASSTSSSDYKLLMQVFQEGERVFKCIPVEDFVSLNLAKLKEFIQGVSEDQWVPSFPKYYPEHMKAPFVSEFRRFYRLIQA